jgi:CHAD domain-containing protein
LVAQRLLGDLVEERVRLGDHPGALHDFRVALRRLRSWLRGFRPWLRDTVRQRSFRELTAIADASSGARDAEVALHWLGGLQLPSRAATGARHLASCIRRDQRKATRAFHAHMDADFAGMVRRLDKQLASYRVNVAPDDPIAVPVMGTVLAGTVREHAVQFDRAVRAVNSADDETAAHEARIAGKRLRYLLEHFDDPRARELVRQLAALQDALGELHDTHVIMGRIAAERAALAKKTRVRGTPDPRPGLYALAARARARSLSANADFRQRWDERGDEILEAATRIAGSA